MTGSMVAAGVLIGLGLGLIRRGVQRQRAWQATYQEFLAHKAAVEAEARWRTAHHITAVRPGWDIAKGGKDAS